MKKWAKKILKYFFLVLLILILVLFAYFFMGKAKNPEKINWGVNFSQKHTQNLGLGWKDLFLALLDDLGAKRFKIAVHWDLIEQGKGNYNFQDLDWQVKELEKRGAGAILVIGVKTSRWPECHIPAWAKGLNKEGQQEEILKVVQTIVLKYKENNSVLAWQVENEPLFPFGECVWTDKDFLKKEISLVKFLDPQKPIIISDSGEVSFWVEAAKLGDIVGMTIYRKIWSEPLGIYVSYPFSPVFYWRKAQIIKKVFGKEVICVELQAEPWGPKLLYDSPLEEQQKSMDLKQFKKNMDFAKNTGLKEFYLWGAEWWYWMKEKQGRPEIWEEAKNLFKEK